MKKPVLGLLCIAALTSAAFAGTETYSGKEMKQVAQPPCPQWYADNEFNVGLWGTYLFGGAGGIFGGGEKTNVVVNDGIIRTEQTGSESRAIGQVGGGMEVRFTPHIGWVSDFSWNFVDGPKNNFGMVRTGVNFAF